MSPFQLYFSFFTLIIGLAVAAVARNFGALWQRKVVAPVGYLTPLLAVFLLLDISRFWLSLWSKQEITSLGPVALSSVLLVALPYVFATTIMFPADPGEWETLDEYYLVHSRAIFASLLFSKISAFVFDLLLFGGRLNRVALLSLAIITAPFIILTIFRSVLVHRIGLIFLVLWSALVFVELA